MQGENNGYKERTIGLLYGEECVYCSYCVAGSEPCARVGSIPLLSLFTRILNFRLSPGVSLGLIPPGVYDY